MQAVKAARTLLRELTAATENPELPTQQVTILLALMDATGPVSMADLVTATGVSQPAVSRNVAILGRGQRIGEKGYDLVEAYEDPTYRRRKLVRLSPRGEALKARIAALH